MKKNIKLSVIIPIYNSEKTLQRCIYSITNQVYKNLEIILVDDCSSDLSLEICNKLSKEDCRIKVIKSSVNMGVSNARNMGIENATGDYVTFVDCDDFIDTYAYEDCMKIIMDENIELLRFSYIKEFGKVKKIRHFKTISNQKIYKKDYNKLVYNNVFSSEDYTSVWNSIIKRTILENIKFDCNIRFAEDFLFTMEVISNSKNLYLLESPYYHYIVNENSCTQSYDFEKIVSRIDNIIVANTKVLNIIENYNIVNMYKIKIISSIKEKIGMIAYKYSYKDFKNLILQIEELDSYKKFLKECKTSKINSSLWVYFRYKIKYCVKQNIKHFLTRNSNS